jgi:hypothetical protein
MDMTVTPCHGSGPKEVEKLLSLTTKETDTTQMLMEMKYSTKELAKMISEISLSPPMMMLDISEDKTKLGSITMQAKVVTLKECKTIKMLGEKP